MIYYMDKVVEHLYDEEISVELTKILNQEIEVNTSAIYCALNAFKKSMRYIDQAVENIK